MLFFTAKKRFAALAVDIIVPLPVTEDGDEYLLFI